MYYRKHWNEGASGDTLAYRTGAIMGSGPS